MGARTLAIHSTNLAAIPGWRASRRKMGRSLVFCCHLQKITILDQKNNISWLRKVSSFFKNNKRRPSFFSKKKKKKKKHDFWAFWKTTKKLQRLQRVNQSTVHLVPGVSAPAPGHWAIAPCWGAAAVAVPGSGWRSWQKFWTTSGRKMGGCLLSSILKLVDFEWFWFDLINISSLQKLQFCVWWSTMQRNGAWQKYLSEKQP